MRVSVTALIIALCVPAVATGQPPPPGTQREYGADRIMRDTYRDAAQNARDFQARQRDSWNRSSGSAAVRQPTPPAYLRRCADEGSAKHACQIIEIVKGENRRSTLRHIADSLGIGPPTHCLAPVDPPAVKLAAWGLYCGLTREQAMALAEAVDPDLAAAREARDAKKGDEARLERVRTSFRELEQAREREKLELVAEKKQRLTECDRGNIASCERFEEIAFAPPAVDTKIWWHSIAQQCRLGNYAKCREGREISRQAYDPKGRIELDEIGCLGGNADQCANTGLWLIAFGGDDVAKGLRMLRQGCTLGDTEACDALRQSVEKGAGGSCAALKEEKKVLQSACRGGDPMACLGKRHKGQLATLEACREAVTRGNYGTAACEALGRAVAARKCVTKWTPAERSALVGACRKLSGLREMCSEVGLRR